jgi:hypothetical protein
MVYTDYKDAAERHLEVCYCIVTQLDTLEIKRQRGGMSNPELKTQMSLLSNLYYLSGYMIECLYSYALCKYEDNRQRVATPPIYPIVGDVKTTLDNATRGTYKICFNYNKRPTNKLDVRYSIQRPEHRMSLQELSFFQVESVLTTSIPLLDNITPLSNPDLQHLFIHWSAYERYKINHFSESTFPPLTYLNIVKFFWEIVDVCAKMSQDILREVTLFRRLIKKRPSTI